MRILVIENIEASAQWLRTVLTAQHCEVIVQADAGTAIGNVVGGAFDLVVADSMLPGLRGEDVIERLRTLGTLVPIILLFPLVGAAPQLPPGVVALERPFSRQQLLDTVQRVVSGVAAAEDGVVEALPDQLPEALLQLARRGVSGVLQVTHEASQRRVTMRGGVPTYVWAEYSSDNFGRFLVRRKVITEEVLEQSHAAMVSKGVAQGEALILLGILQQAQLYALLKAYHRERLLTMFTWPSPSLEFAEGREIPRGEPVYAIDPIPLVFEGYQRHGSTDDLFHWPEKHGDSYVRRCPNFDVYFPMLQSQWPRLPLTQLTAGGEPLHMILRALPVDVIFAVRTLSALISLEMIELVDAPVAESSEVFVIEVEDSQIIGEYNLDRGRGDFDVDLDEQIDPRVNQVFETYLSLQFVSYYELLAVPANATASIVATAYESLRGHYEELLEGLGSQPEAVAKAQEILVHLQFAWAVLNQPDTRLAYDKKLLEKQNATVKRRASLGAEARFKSGLHALRAGRFQVARIEFEAARALRAGDALCNLYTLWASYLQQREAVRKMGELRRDLDAQARLLGDAEGYAFHAWICLDLGFVDNARQAAAQALNIDEASVEANNVWRALEDLEKAT
ncbi:MAG: DUF4388 domain-containing protein [Pseudomonadota bacterium]